MSGKVDATLDTLSQVADSVMYVDVSSRPVSLDRFFFSGRVKKSMVSCCLQGAIKVSRYFNCLNNV